MKVVVSDTSCISNLLAIDQLHLLKDTYQNILIPPAVFAEVVAIEKFGASTENFRGASWIEIVIPSDIALKNIARYSLDKGETEAIALASELKDVILIIDEARGRGIAAQLGIHTTGLIGILIKAKEEGRILSVKEILDILIIKAHFRVSESLYNDVLKIVNEK
jgi:predicted nucleic acid-binding protein